MKVYYGNICENNKVSEMGSGDKMFIYRADYTRVELLDKKKQFIASNIPISKTIKSYTVVIVKDLGRIEIRDTDTNEIVLAICSTPEHNVFIYQFGSETIARVSSCDFEISE